MSCETWGLSRVLFELEAGSRFNDIGTDPNGRLYVGTLRFDPFNPEALPTPGELYRVDSEGEATQLYDDVGLTNGIGFSPDGQTIYHSDSLRRHIIAHRIKDDGSCIERHIFAQLPKVRRTVCVLTPRAAFGWQPMGWLNFAA